MLVNKAHQGQGAVPHAHFLVSGNGQKLTSGQELALYRIVQEALTNVRKHARATGVRVELKFSEQAVHLVVQDDGQGFVLPGSMTELIQNGSLGLMGIQERVWAEEGELSVESQPGVGTRLEVTLPTQLQNIDPV
jgi:two-component system sensor histidine kinase DegS